MVAPFVDLIVQFIPFAAAAAPRSPILSPSAPGLSSYRCISAHAKSSARDMRVVFRRVTATAVLENFTQSAAALVRAALKRSTPFSLRLINLLRFCTPLPLRGPTTLANLGAK